VQRNIVPLYNGHVLDQQTNHAFAFPVRQSGVMPNLPKISCQREDLPGLRVVEDEMV
jgi:hypothetical protein